jgi:hypothetical protein
MVQLAIVEYFSEVPQAADIQPGDDNFRVQVEGEIRSALLGSGADLPDFSTERAFVSITGAAPAELTALLSAIPRRPAQRPLGGAAIRRLAAERTLRFNPDVDTGAVIFASPVPGVYYEEWYTVLLLDRLIRRVIPLKVSTSLPLVLEQYYYRIEIPVLQGQLLETVEQSLMQEIQRLQFVQATAADLEAAKADARAFLQNAQTREWFESHGIPERRNEGLEWIESISADDLRATARDLIVANRVLATWAPKVRQTTVQVESLTEPLTQASPETAIAPEPQLSAVTVQPFPPHSHVPYAPSAAERLPSGVSLMASVGAGVFVAGAGLSTFEDDGGPPLSQFERYRPERILVLSRPESLERMRQSWSGFRGNAEDRDLVLPSVTVSSGDLPAVLVLKAMLDRKVIAAGWWSDVDLGIDATRGATLQITATPDKKGRIVEWIKGIANEDLPEADFAWAREVARHRFAIEQMDVQSLTWQQDPSGTVQDVQTVSAQHVRDVARVYFPLF